MRANLEALAMAHRRNRHGRAFSQLFPAARRILGSKARKYFDQRSDPDVIDDAVALAILELDRSISRWRHVCPLCKESFLLGRELKRHGEKVHRLRGLKSAKPPFNYAINNAYQQIKHLAKEYLEQEQLLIRYAAMTPGDRPEDHYAFAVTDGVAMMEALEHASLALKGHGGRGHGKTRVRYQKR